MLKTTILKSLLVLIMAVALGGESMAQNRIKFARGQNSATVKGTIGKDGDVRYTVRGTKGKTITVRVVSGNNYVFAGVEAVGEGRTVTGKLQYDGDYIIELSNGGNQTNFTMTVTIR